MMDLQKMEEIDEYSIAVIGLSCRFPEASSPEEFWNNLVEGKDAVKRFSKEELAEEGIPEELRNHPDYVPASGYVEGVKEFDGDFFQFSDKECETMDPQFRLFFECAWEAFEDAGRLPQEEKDPVGVFAGAGMSLYSGTQMNSYFNYYLQSDQGTLEAMEGPQVIIGNKADYLPSRVAYKFNLKGPAVNIQTACSTSLVAVHHAVQSILNGECEMALAGASAIHSPVKCGYLYTQGSMYSPDGHCRTFDEKAQGIVGGNGVGVVLLKRLKNAVEDGDPIHAVIKSSAINNDGNAKVSYMAPSIEGQVDVIEQALSLADVSPESITYVEAHGTGTALGDPIEVAALQQVYSKHTTKKNYCTIGSVKTNIGHLDTAAGMAGLIKTILSLKNKKLPATLHYQKSNPHINLENSPFQVSTQTKDWNPEGIRRAAISALGAGGTNAHLILDEYVAPQPNNKGATEKEQSFILPLSGKTEKAVTDLLKKHEGAISSLSEQDLSAYVYTTQIGRSNWDYSAAAIGKSKEELLESLKQSIEGKKVVKQPESKSLVWLFSGQGSQYLNMGKAMYESETVFKAAFDTCHALFHKHASIALHELLADLAAIHETQYTQPLLFSLQYSLAQWWISLGVKPDQVVGHSIGEFAAACIAGVFSLEDAIKMVAVRGQLMQHAPGNGKMCVAMASEKEVKELIKEFSTLEIAGVNHAESITISGGDSDINGFVEKAESNGLMVLPLSVSHAFHSNMMAPVIEEWKKVLATISFQSPQIQMVSTLTGNYVKAEIATAQYWIDQLLSAVDFYQAIVNLNKETNKELVFLEIGPKHTLVNLCNSILDLSGDQLIASLSPKVENQQQQALAQLWMLGEKVDWIKTWKVVPNKMNGVPTYAFQRKTHWVDKRSIKQQQGGLSEISKKAFLDQVKGFQLDPESPLFWEHLYEQLQQVGGEKVTEEKNSQWKQVWKTFVPTHDPNEQVNQFWLDDQMNKGITLDQLKDIALEPVSLSELRGKELGNEVVNLFWFLQPTEETAKNYFEVWKKYQQLIEEKQWEKKIKLHILTTRAQSIAEQDQTLDCWNAAFWGFVKCLRLEYTELAIQTIDLEGKEALTKAVLTLNTTYPMVALRQGQWYAPFIEKATASSSKPFTPGNHVLITGANGGIAQEFIYKLIEKGVRQFTLVSRSQENQELSKLMKSAQEKGVNIRFYQSNLTKEEELSNIKNEVESTGNAVSCIIHLAGILQDQLLSKLTWESVKEVMLPKKEGLHQLASVFSTTPLFINFSSVASIFGSVGQTNYVMANAWMEAYSFNHGNETRQFLSYQWGPWDNVGMAARNAEKGKINGHEYLVPLALEQGIKYLETLPEQGQPDFLLPLTIALPDEMELTVFAQAIWFGEGITEENNQQGTSSFSLLSEKEKENHIRVTIQEKVRMVVGNASNEALKEQGFVQVGMDSMMGLQFRNLLQKEYDLSLPSTLIYKYNNVEQLTDFLLEHLHKQNEQEEEKELDELSEEELSLLLKSELDN